MPTLDIEESLSYNYMFRGLPQEAVHELAILADLRSFSGGDTMVRQFDSSTDLFVIVEGNAISRTFAGEVVARFGPGSVVGEVAFLDGQKRSANVVAVGECKVVVISSKALWALMERNHAVGYLVLKNLSVVLCKRLRSMNEFADSASGPSRR